MRHSALFFLLPLAVVASLLFVFVLARSGAQANPGATITVNSTDDGGSSYDMLTLREAMLLAIGVLTVGSLDEGECGQVSNSSYNGGCSTTDAIGAASADTIVFDTTVFSPDTISLGSTLPTLSTGGDTVDGSEAGVVVDGVGKTFDCFDITSDNNTIKGLEIYNCNDGIYIHSGAQDNVIGGSEEGQRNVISGNGWSGVWIRDPGTTGNKVIGNRIGTDADGSVAVPNKWGVYIGEGAQNNVIGGSSLSGEGNLISGNTSTAADRPAGVMISDEGTTNNLVIGNYIGTNAAGTDSIYGSMPNFPIGDGVTIADGASNNIIGGSTEGERNIISGNGWSGVWIRDAGSTENRVIGNYIGTDVSGTSAVRNEWCGVYVELGAHHNEVQGNLISGNTSKHHRDEESNLPAEVMIRDNGTTGNRVIGNKIGTNAAGTDSVVGAPDGEGVIIAFGASNNIIGGSAEGEGNVISGNVWSGVWIWDAGTTENRVIGNYIGTDVSGVLGVPNEWGVYVGEWDGVGDGAQNNVIGGTGEHEGNIIAFNRSDGVTVSGSSSTGNSIRRNSIHSNVDKGIALTNGGNDELARPVIDSVGGSVSGDTSPKCYPCTVEIFSDDDDEGRIYHDSTTTNDDATGTWSYPGAVTGPKVTATITDEHGNTSEFSEPSPWSPPVSITRLTDGKVDFGVQALSVTGPVIINTTPAGIGDVERVRVDSGPVDLLIRSTAFADGPNVWSLGTDYGTDKVVWAFDDHTTTPIWTTFEDPDTEYPMASDLLPEHIHEIVFQLTMPTETSSNNPHSATVTVVAVAHE